MQTTFHFWQLLQLVPTDGCPQASEDVSADIQGALPKPGSRELVKGGAVETSISQPGELSAGNAP